MKKKYCTFCGSKLELTGNPVGYNAFTGEKRKEFCCPLYIKAKDDFYFHTCFIEEDSEKDN